MATMQEHPATSASERGATLTSVRESHNDAENHTSSMDVDDHTALKTPTRDSFAGDAAQQSNSVSPTNAAGTSSQPNPKKGARSRADSIVRTDSLRSNRSIDSGDVDMDDDDEDGSDNESATSETGRPSKKKKGQRFFCTEFPPCQLSFTRSEHLARHIRKHTGERPFQCHCLRRFSRLDNLRQHAQTVHVNEEIPGDSLAATGTRFQRQIRTDRMRTPGNRARATTISGATGAHSRGHSRNYSGSSIGSISDLGSPDDGRRRPQPLAMARTPPRGLTVDAYAANAVGHEAGYPYFNQSPTGYSSPPSVFPGDPSSPPSMPPHLQSPIAMAQRSFTWGDRIPNRRLSVPSGTTVFQSSAPYNPGVSYMSPLASSNASTYSNSGSIVQSPTSSVFSDSRRESIAGEVDIRRRTWHPGTYVYTARPATSGLTYYQTPDAPQPVVATQPAAAQNVRLPGIDSFDRATERPDAPPRRAPSPMEVDTPSRRASISSPVAPVNSAGPQDQKYLQYSRQDEFAESPPEIFSIGSRNMSQRPVTASQAQPQVSRRHPPQPLITSNEAPTNCRGEAPVTPRQKKRQGWYNGPLSGPQEQPIFQAPRTSPEGSSSSDGLPTPSTSSAIEYRPTIIHSNGEIESGHLGFAMDDNQKTNDVAHNAHQFRAHDPSGRTSHDMERLDALVAVATSENRVAER